MKRLLLEAERPEILCLGAHSDDIEIGAGATLLHVLDGVPSAKVHWVVFSGDGERADETRRGAKLFAGEHLASVAVHGFRDGFLPASFEDVKEVFRDLHGHVEPDVILTHWRGDLHQDHRLISELTGQTFRDHLILEYEILKYDGDLGRPNFYVPVTDSEADQKVANLLEAFPSQRGKHWFEEDTFYGLMRVRGVECRSPSGYAEAFHGYKAVLDNLIPKAASRDGIE